MKTLPCFLHKLNDSKRERKTGRVQVSNLMFYAQSASKAVSGRRLIPNETFIISNGTQPLMTWGTSWCKWGKLLSSECWIGLRQLFSTSLHRTTWRSDWKLVRKEAGLRQLFSTSLRRATWWSDWKLVRKEAGLRAQHGILCGGLFTAKGCCCQHSVNCNASAPSDCHFDTVTL